MKNKSLKKIIYILLLMIFLASCKNKMYMNYTDLFLGDNELSSTISGPYLALSVMNRNKVEFLICPSYDLKDCMLFYGNFTHKEYKNDIINSIEKNFPLEINDSLFKFLQINNYFVYRNNSIDSLFNLYHEHLDILIYDVLCYKDLPYQPLTIKSSKDAEWYSESAYNYLFYILFQYGFYVVKDEEEGYYGIYPESKGFKYWKAQ